MNLLIRLNVVFIIAFTLAGWIAHEVFAPLQRSAARREMLATAGLMLATAGLMLGSALASRAYTPTEIDPLLAAKLDSPEDQRRFLKARQ
jgi:hypothetical protein